MQDYPSLTRAGKRFRGNVEDTEQSQVRHREKPLKGSTRVLDRHLHSYWIAIHRLLHHPSIILRPEVAREAV